MNGIVGRTERRTFTRPHGGHRDDGDVQFRADLQLKTHDDEFGNASATGSNRQGVERDGHKFYPMIFPCPKHRRSRLDEVEGTKEHHL